MENIFKDAYFGKPYKTRDGRKAIYYKYSENLKHHKLLIENDGINFYTKHGDYICGIMLNENLDIVSEWIEEINKNEINKSFQEFIDTSKSEYLNIPLINFCKKFIINN